MTDASFLEEVLYDSGHKGARCTTAAVLATLPDDLREQVEAAMADPTATGTAIGRALTKRGYVIKGESIQRHRRGACSCG